MSKQKKITAAAYLEVDASEKDNEKEMLKHKEFIQKVGAGLGAELVTGTADYGRPEKLEQRQGLSNLFKHLSEHKVDYVIIPYLDMLSEEEQEQKELMEKIEETGAKIISISLCGEAGHEQYSDILDDAVFEAYFEIAG